MPDRTRDLRKDHGEITCPDHEAPCRIIEGINETDWEQVKAVADRFDDPGRFVAVPGFEWSTPTVGHLNVWYSRDYTDALHQNAFVTPRATSETDRVGPPPRSRTSSKGRPTSRP